MIDACSVSTHSGTAAGASTSMRPSTTSSPTAACVIDFAMLHEISGESAVVPPSSGDAPAGTTIKPTINTAAETEIAAEATGLPVEQFADLMERTSGEAEGLTIAEYTERYGRAPWTDWSNPLSPGGESGLEFFVRVTTAIDRVAEEGRGRTTWVICHGGVIMVTAIGRWPGGGSDGPSDLSTIPLASPMNSSISEWTVEPTGGWRMVRFNDHTHLVGVSSGDAPASI